MADLIKKITRISDLPDLKGTYGKTIVALNRDNYAIDLSLIKGKKIEDIQEVKSTSPKYPNVYIIKFSDGSTEMLKAYNGTDGDQGEKGYPGPDGEDGDTIPLDVSLTLGAQDKYTIVNQKTILNVKKDKYGNFVDDEGNIMDDIIDVHDEQCEQAWSAYRGISLNKSIDAINEMFMTEEDYDELFTTGYVEYIDAEFTTSEPNQEACLFNDDTNLHTKFQKYWTYEDTDVDTYYVYNAKSGTYDAVAASLWDDIYLGEHSGYFLATTRQFSDGTKLFFYDSKNKEYAEIADHFFENEETGAFISKDYFEFNFFDPDLNEYVKIHYDYGTSAYDYALVADSEIQKQVYTYVRTDTEYEEYDRTKIKDDDGNTYYRKAFIDNEANANEKIYVKELSDVFELVTDMSSIDMNGYVSYFKKNEDGTYSLIENISEYLETPEKRWFVIDANGHLNEVGSEEDVDISNFQEYFQVTINKVKSAWIFERWRPYVKYDENYYEHITKTYGKNGVPLYVYWDDRTYYTMVSNITTDAEGNPIVTNEYIPVEIPDWIFAEFTTLSEDENTLILNAAGVKGNSEDEDNTEVDTSDEGYEEELPDVVPVHFMTAGDLPNIYYYDSNTGIYADVELEYWSNSIRYLENGELDINENYVYDTGEHEYKKVNIEDITSGMVVYKKDDEGNYVVVDEVDDETAEYFTLETIYSPVTADLFKEHQLTLVTGIPQQLQIWFFPLDTNNKKAVIDYDDSKIAFYEGGRIASLEEFEENEGYKETDIVITPETGQGLHIHVKLVKPVASIDVESAGYGFINAKVYEGMPSMLEGSSEILKALVRPAKASDKTLEYATSEGFVEFGEQEHVTGSNEVSIPVQGISQGLDTIIITAADGYNATATIQIDVVKPVEEATWVEGTGANDIKDIPRKYFTSEYEVDQYNREHGYEFGDDNYVEWNNANPPIKEERHYEISILKGIPTRLNINNDPKDSSKTDYTWTITPSNATIEKVVDVIEETRKATSEDVDNGLAENIDDDIIVSTTTDTYYSITGNKTGECWIHGVNKFNAAYYDGNADAVTNTTLDIKAVVLQSVETITVEPSNLTFPVGKTKKLEAIVAPDNATEKGYTWESSDPAIASVSNDSASFGVVTGKTEGNVTISAVAIDGSNRRGTCSVRITNAIDNISFSNGIVYVGVDNSETVTASLTGIDNVGISDADIEWLSADTSIAEVNGSYKTATITGKAIGSTTIIARDRSNSGAIGTLQVNVIKLVESLVFKEECSNLSININDIVVMAADFTPSDASVQVLEFSSSDASIAKVTNDGIVTALAEGTVEITATTTDGTAITATTTIEVTK